MLTTMKQFSITICISILTILSANAQELYHKARIWMNDERDLQTFAEMGLDVDHGTYKKGTFVENDFSVREIEEIQAAGYKVELLIEDVSSYYVEQSKLPVESLQKNAECAVLPGSEYSPLIPSNFALGNYAGYYTTQEMFDILEEMHNLYPNLISEPAPVSDTLTHEGRTIYYWRISDNPAVQQNKPRVLYTSLIHAREPGSLSETLFYMWYLLENYGTDPEVTYLIDHTEMYFVPMLNPDGCARNEQTNPNGGGMHRKNRNPNHGTTNRGVDLNRNFSYQWGTTGVSFNGNNDTYPGTGPFSEPESQNLKKIAEQWGVTFAFNAHTYSKLMLFPIGATAAEFADDHNYFDAIGSEMVVHSNYESMKSSGLYPASGDTDDYMYVEHGIFALTPEVGGAFWSPQSEILGDCIDMLYSNLVLAHLPHVYGVAEDITPSIYLSSITGEFEHSITRLGQQAGPLTVSITPIQGIAGISAPIEYNLDILEEQTGMIEYTLDNNLNFGDLVVYVLNVDNGQWIKRDTITKIYGMATLQFADNAQTTDNWIGDWALTTEDFVSSPTSFTDSPNGNYAADAFEIFELDQTVDLTEATSAAVRFQAKWFIESGWDYVQFQVSTDNGMSWEAQCGKYTKPGVNNSGNTQPIGEPLYDGFQADWVLEEINLSDYLGQEIKMRFILVADAFVHYDGFYFDDFELLYDLSPTAGLMDEENPFFSLHPNPANDRVKVAMNTPISEGTISVFDATGKLVLEQAISQLTNMVELNISSLNQGIYNVRFQHHEMVSANKRLVIVK